MPDRDYPASVSEVLRNGMKFNRDALRAVQTFAHSKPWHGTVRERVAKFRKVLKELSVAYGIVEPRFQVEHINRDAETGNGFYSPSLHLIVLVGKLSVVTLLHEFAHARGYGERGACRWSINLFKRCFPRSYARCGTSGHMLTSR